MSSYSPAPRCEAAHSRFQPGAAEWKCPKCSAEYPKFRIDEQAPGASKKCHKLHVDDDVVCLSCGGQWSGQEVITLIKANHNLMTCPHCHGKGAISQ